MTRGSKMIPPAWFGQLSDQEWHEIIESNGVISGNTLERLWSFAGWTEPCPESLTLLINKADLMRAFPPKSSGGSR